MLQNNIAYLYVDEKSLEIFKNSSCTLGILIGSVNKKYISYFKFKIKIRKKKEKR
jgi:hypothetical protein